MGAEPRAALLSLVLPEGFAVDELEALLDGLLALAATHRIALVGGNITRSPGPLIVDVTAIGSVHRRRVLKRAGARPGDVVFVTGSLGEGAIGLRRLQDGGAAAVGTSERHYLRPQPRVRAGLLLGRNRVASSCMDLSDGLADGVRQIANASGVGMVLDASTLPIGADVMSWHEHHGGNATDTALRGGDDYELLFTVRPAHLGRVRGVRQHVGDLPITRIGVVTKGKDVLLRDEQGTREMPTGYEHFRM